MKTWVARSGAVIVLAGSALTAGILMREGRGPMVDGGYVPYWDKIGKVWTVCGGITGKHVIPGKWYSRKECEDLESGEIEKHGLRMLECTNPPHIEQHQYNALTSLAYNVGTGWFCDRAPPGKPPNIGDLMRAGRMAEACARISAFRFAGGKDCCAAEQSKVCSGICTRREAERAECEGRSKALPALGATG